MDHWVGKLVTINGTVINKHSEGRVVLNAVFNNLLYSTELRLEDKAREEPPYNTLRSTVHTAPY